MVATGSQDKTVKVWKSTDLSLLLSLQGHKRGVWDIAFSPVEKVLVSASGDMSLKVWNLSTGACLSTLEGHQQPLVKVNWLNFGLQLVSASVDGVVKVWNLKKQVCLNTYEMHEEKVWALDTYGEFLLTGAADSHIKLWQDCTVEREAEEKDRELQKVKDEQALSNLMLKSDFREAALLAFQLNRYRDFYYACQKLLKPAMNREPVGAIMENGRGETSAQVGDL